MEKNENFKSELETQYALLIQAQERKEKIVCILILSLLLLTLVSVLVSAFFSIRAFIATVNMKEKAENRNETFYQTLTTTYNDSSSLILNNIVSGYKLLTPKVIQISNEGDTDITFDIKITSINTSLLSTNNLVYSITKNGEASVSKELPLTEKSILNNVKIKPDETITYILNVSFTGIIDQSITNSYYNANIVVEQIDSKSNLLE